MAAKPTLPALFQQEESPLLRFAFGFVGRREVAEEIVQEAFARVHEHWEDVENPRAWIYRATRNLALSHLRDHKRETELGEQAETTPDVNPYPDQALWRHEALGIVRMLLAELAPEDRELIDLKFTEGMKYSEIGQKTGLSVGNVGYRLHHLLKSLALSLRQAGITTSEG